jgi:hypothetical protein
MHKPAPSERSFGTSVGSVLVVLGAIALWRNRQTVGTTMVAVGGVLVLLGLVAPTLLRVPNRIWWRFAQTLGWVNSRILLTVFFAVVITPVGLVMRALGRNPLRPVDEKTGWTPSPARHHDPKHFERMF